MWRDYIGDGVLEGWERATCVRALDVSRVFLADCAMSRPGQGDT